jgi:hypothetical protein
MTGDFLLGCCFGTVVSASVLHWLYQRSADKWEQRMRDEITSLRAEVERLRMTEAERESLATQPASWPEEEIACESAFASSGAPHDWPDDEPATVTRMAASMSAECVRLREEVNRLRLTDAERKAVDYFGFFGGGVNLDTTRHAAALRGLWVRAAKNEQ